MYQIQGHFSNATIFNDHIDAQTIAQLKHILDQPLAKNTHVALMPDGHFGAGVPVGTTIKLLASFKDQQIAPTIISGDIGCGMLAVELQLDEIDYQKLDDTINKLIPTGANRHAEDNALDPIAANQMLSQFQMPHTKQLANDLKTTLGTLGGGNHFIYPLS